MELTYQLTEINYVAEQLLKSLNHRKLIAFHGEMGAGKTTLIQAICHALGADASFGSPTFSIINEYADGHGDPVYHIDLYRLKDQEEAVRAGVEDCIDSGYYCFVEWPERAEALFPSDTAHCHIKTLNSNTRNLQLML